MLDTLLVSRAIPPGCSGKTSNPRPTSSNRWGGATKHVPTVGDNMLQEQAHSRGSGQGGRITPGTAER